MPPCCAPTTPPAAVGVCRGSANPGGSLRFRRVSTLTVTVATAPLMWLKSSVICEMPAAAFPLRLISGSGIKTHLDRDVFEQIADLLQRPKDLLRQPLTEGPGHSLAPREFIHDRPLLAWVHVGDRIGESLPFLTHPLQDVRRPLPRGSELTISVDSYRSLPIPDEPRGDHR